MGSVRLWMCSILWWPTQRTSLETLMRARVVAPPHALAQHANTNTHFSDCCAPNRYKWAALDWMGRVYREQRRIEKSIWCHTVWSSSYSTSKADSSTTYVVPPSRPQSVCIATWFADGIDRYDK